MSKEYTQELTPEQEREGREAQNRYLREYRRKNPDKVRTWNANYWGRRAAKEKAKREGMTD